MSDRELLELAAKAAGMDVLPADKPWPRDSRGWFFNEHWASGGGMHRIGGGFWNPLTDDGDALRLAVKLGLCVGKAVHAPQRFACPQETDDAFYEEENGDPAAATRRAVVRAAAEIGRKQ